MPLFTPTPLSTLFCLLMIIKNSGNYTFFFHIVDSNIYPRGGTQIKTLYLHTTGTPTGKKPKNSNLTHEQESKNLTSAGNRAGRLTA